MPKLNYRAESRKEYVVNKEEGLGLFDNELQLGAILRIADATEKMAQNWNELTADRDWWKKRYQSMEGSYNKSCKSNAALKGHITRLKNKITNSH
jgi:hypothetical protein